jgi:hypothetical protein
VERVDAGRLEAGVHSVEMDTGGYASGVYTVKALSGDEESVKRMVVVK